MKPTAVPAAFRTKLSARPARGLSISVKMLSIWLKNGGVLSPDGFHIRSTTASAIHTAGLSCFLRRVPGVVFHDDTASAVAHQFSYMGRIDQAGMMLPGKPAYGKPAESVGYAADDPLRMHKIKIPHDFEPVQLDNLQLAVAYFFGNSMNR